MINDHRASSTHLYLHIQPSLTAVISFLVFAAAHDLTAAAPSPSRYRQWLVVNERCESH